MRHVKTVRPLNCQFSPEFPLQVNIVTSHFYEAIIYYSSMVRDMYRAGLDYRDGMAMADFYGNYTFLSPISGQVFIDHAGDRISVYVLRTYDPRKCKFEVRYGHL